VSPLVSRFRKLLSGGADELGRDDLLRRVVDGCFALKTFGARGAEVFPRSVLVRVQVASGAVELIRNLVEEPAFDREIEARLLNRMVDAQKRALPLRRYVVESGERDQVRVEEDGHGALVCLRIEGGDLDGRLLELLSARQEFRLGRGAWHGGDQRIPNDLVVTDSLVFVSRAAAVLRRAGTLFELESRDQRECLAVVRPTGERIRPALSASGRCLVQPGDCIELNDGRGVAIRLFLEA
jgi:hypothetical protein